MEKAIATNESHSPLYRTSIQANVGHLNLFLVTVDQSQVLNRGWLYISCLSRQLFDLDPGMA